MNRIISRWSQLLGVAALLLAFHVPAFAKQTVAVEELFNYDRTLTLDSEETTDKETPEYKSYKVSYRSANNQRVPAMLAMPTVAGPEKRPCVVLQHGLGQTKMDLAVLWGFLARAGFAVFSIDAQFHGERAPKTVPNIFGAAQYSTRECIIQTVIDLRRAVDYLVSRKDIDPNKIGYAGFSMGGIIGTVANAVEPRFKAPVLALAGGNWKLMYEKSTHGNVKAARDAASAATPLDFHVLDPFDPVKWVDKIAPRPILFINGDADTVVPVEAGQELQKAAGEGKEIFIYKGGHVPAGGELFRTMGRILKWMQDHIK